MPTLKYWDGAQYVPIAGGMSLAAADARYLQQADADARYLQQADADARYLQQADADARYVQQTGGTMTADPTEPLGIATKQYVDELVQSGNITFAGSGAMPAGSGHGLNVVFPVPFTYVPYVVASVRVTSPITPGYIATALPESKLNVIVSSVTTTGCAIAIYTPDAINFTTLGVSADWIAR